MPTLFGPRRYSPIGIDLGSRSVKLVQFTADHSKLVDAARWDLPAEPANASPDELQTRIVEALTRAREGREFRGKEAVLCLSERELFLQNIRVPQGDAATLERAVQQEAAGRIPYPVAETEIRFLEAADVRQGDQMMREVILMACHRPVLERALATIEGAGLTPVALEVEPIAVTRSYGQQFRRDEDRQVRSLLVQIGFGGTLAVVVQGDEILFVKYIELGGKHLDDAVARSLKMDLTEATSLRRHNGDRRSDRQDPEITRSIHEATRAVLEKLLGELAMCVRYHSVTFRGQPLERLILGGGEASPALLEMLQKRLGLKCELSDALRHFQSPNVRGRNGQWDVAAGLALRRVC